MNHCHLSQTNERNWRILQLNTCFLLSNGQLNNHTPSSWSSEDECGFALSMFTENITFSSPLSSYILIPTGRNICGKRPWRTGDPLSISLTLCYLCIKPEPWETCTHRSPCSAPLKNYLYWQICGHKGRGWGGMNWEIGVDIYILLCIK